MKMYNRKNFGFNNFNKKKILVVFIIYIFFFAFFLSVGFAAFQETMVMEDISAEVRIAMDVRVSGVNVNSFSTNSVASNTDYNYNRIYGDILLPDSDSYVIYEMSITNLGNAKAGISTMTSLNENLKYTLLDYNLGSPISEDGAYTLGITQKILVKVEYADGVTPTNTKQTLNIELTFGGFHSVVYHGVPGQENHPLEVMDGWDLVITSELTSIDRLKVTQDTVFLVYDEHYFYDDTIKELTVKNVTGDLLLSYRDTAYLMNLSTNAVPYKASEYKDKIVQIEFVDEINISNAIATFDLSENQDNSIIGWINDNGNNRYNLYIGSIYDIYTKNFERAFSNMYGLRIIKFDNLNTNESRSFNYTFYQTKITNLDLSTFNTSRAEQMVCMFADMTELETLDVSNFNTENVTSMWNMFGGVSKLTELNISTFNTSNVTSMAYMFSGMTNLENLTLGKNFNTRKVITMENMFANLTSIKELDLSMFDTSSLNNVQHMFSGTTGLTELDLSSFNTLGISSMNYMFYNMKRLESINLSSFDTSNVSNMEGMFKGCMSLTTLDLTNFDTSRVTNMSNMFDSMYSLQKIDLSSFNTSKVEKIKEFMLYCNNLKELDFRNASFSNVTDSTDMFKNIPSTITVVVKDDTAKTFIQNKLGAGRGTIIIYTPSTDEGTSTENETTQ